MGGPATDEAIVRAALDDKPIVVVPVAFVSEHSGRWWSWISVPAYCRDSRRPGLCARAHGFRPIRISSWGSPIWCSRRWRATRRCRDGMGRHYCADGEMRLSRPRKLRQ